jgi:hypothetical protein
MNLLLWICTFLLSLSSGINTAECAEINQIPIPMDLGTQHFVSSLTKGYTTFPTDVELTRAINRAVSPPMNDCFEEVEVGQVNLNSEPLCDLAGMSSSWISNCNSILNDKLVPSDAFKYTLKVLHRNNESFESNKCYKMQNSAHYSMRSLTKPKFEQQMKDGLPNKCQMIINDIREKVDKNKPYRRKMYYIDMCNPGKPKIIEDYMNIGVGTFVNNYENIEGKKTTVLGAFFTATKTFDLSFKKKKYKEIRKKIKQDSGRYYATGLQMFGLNKTNNNSSINNKYLHVSPYNSSWGCPSVSWQNYKLIEQMSQNGPSLVVNYGDSKRMEDIDVCSKD